MNNAGLTCLLICQSCYKYDWKITFLPSLSTKIAESNKLANNHWSLKKWTSRLWVIMKQKYIPLINKLLIFVYWIMFTIKKTPKVHFEETRLISILVIDIINIHFPFQYEALKKPVNADLSTTAVIKMRKELRSLLSITALYYYTNIRFNFFLQAILKYLIIMYSEFLSFEFRCTFAHKLMLHLWHYIYDKII